MKAITFPGRRNKFVAGTAACSVFALIGIIAAVIGGVLGGNWIVLSLAALPVIFGGIAGAVISISALLSPPELEVDSSGLTMSAQGKNVQVEWSKLEKVSIIRQATPTGRGGLLLMVWPKESLDLPQRGTYLPKWDTKHAGVKFCELDYLNASSAEVIDAVSHHAGALWSESPDAQ
jgi:hypothetical protein